MIDDWDRQQIDPEGRYPADELSTVEEITRIVLSILPKARFERTRDVFQIEDGGNRGIVVVITPEAIELRLPTKEWPHPHCCVEISRLWKRILMADLPPMNKKEFSTEVKRLITSVRRKRRREFRQCRHCGERFPPERRFGSDICHSCASKHLGIVY